MSGALDRIRRVLSDAGPALRRAADVPLPGAVTDDDPARRRLRERLAAIRAGEVGTGGRALPTSGEPSAAPAFSLDDFEGPEEDDRPLEERVGAVVESGAKGSFLVVTRRWPLAGRHGDVLLSEVLARPLPLRRTERRRGGATAIDARDAVFLDVETTGLSGGTGTIAFLIGTGRVERDDFVVKQYFLRDFPDEPAALSALASDLADAPLVTFNGRSFDWPLLSTRWRIHRTPVADRDHADLLPPSRRVWQGSLSTHTLSAIERHALGIARGEDLPGALMPAAYFGWLRTGRAGALSKAFRHNEVDVVSMAALWAVVTRVLAAPSARPTAVAGDHLGTANLLLQHGDPAGARACLEAAFAAGFGRETPALWRALGDLQRQARDLPAAERTWRRWLVEAPRFDPHPFESLAKVEEHVRKDRSAALALTEEALARCPEGHPARGDLEHRANRLRRRLRS